MMGYTRIFCLIAMLVAVEAHQAQNSGKAELNDLVADMWTEGVDVARVLWKECSRQIIDTNTTSIRPENFPRLVTCAKRKTLKALDRTLNTDVISLSPGIHLVKYEELDREGKAVKHNEGNHNSSEADGDWRYLVLHRMARVFDTHVLKFDFQDRDNGEKVEARHRRRAHMMQMMMFGIMSMGMILVPMGFQFLAVLGGKALLLAKLALLLSSIQGLKKIATSPINYGLYHVADGHIEKRANEWITNPTISKSDDRQETQPNKYRFEGDSRLWPSDQSKTAKRSVYSPVFTPNIYPVYPASQPEIYPYIVPNFNPSPPYNIDEPGTEIHAEYTIDLPVNKVQFKSNAPLQSS